MEFDPAELTSVLTDEDEGRHEVKKLSLNKETIRNLTNDELGQVAGGNATATTCIPCEITCGTCDTLCCPTEWFTCRNCITGEPFCHVTGGLNTCECL